MEFTKEELAIIVLCVRGYRVYSTCGDPRTQEVNRCTASAILEVMNGILISDKDIVQRFIDLESKIDEEIPPREFFDEHEKFENQLKTTASFKTRKNHLSIVQTNQDG